MEDTLSNPVEARDWSNISAYLPATNPEHLASLLGPYAPAPLPAVAFGDRLKLKSLNVHLDMSEETLAFSANVYFDAKCIGTARNNGQGGATFVLPNKAGSLPEATSWAAALPPVSSYDPIYKSLTTGAWGSYIGEDAEEIDSAWWFSTERVDLDFLVDRIVETAAIKKEIQANMGIGSLVILGPKHGRESEPPKIMKYGSAADAKKVVEMAPSSGHTYAMLLKECVDTGRHLYHPAPHPFSGGVPQQVVTVDGRRGKISAFGTNDYHIGVIFPDNPGATEVFTPGEVQLAETL